MLISLVVPVFNEEEAIPYFYNEVRGVFNNIKDYSYEIVFVDDGSKDDTKGIIKNLSKTDKGIKYISFSRNFGKESAMYAGLEYAKGEYVAVMDADLQDPPALIPEMIEILNEGEYECVASRRVTRKGEPVIRSFFARTFYKVINSISDVEFVDGARDFRLMKREVVESVLELSEYNRFSKGLFMWVGYNIKWLEYENVERVAGETKWSFWGLFKYAIEGIVAFSTFPLRLSTITGSITMILSVIYLIYLLVRGIAATMTVLPTILIFLCGVILLAIGVLGEYLARTYIEVKNRPIYIIKESNMNKE